MSSKRRKINPPELHVNGYEIIRNGFTTSEKLLSELRRQSNSRGCGAIFNENSESGNDLRRRQACLKNTSKIISTFIDEVEGKLEHHMKTHHATSRVILKSLPGCQRQLAHSDNLPDKKLAETIVLENWDQIPLAVVCSVEDSTIDIWDGAINWIIPGAIKKDIPRTTVPLSPGDILVFRGDLIHGGSAYDEENIRVHFYLDSKKHPHTYNMVYTLEGAKEWEKHILEK